MFVVFALVDGTLDTVVANFCYKYLILVGLEMRWNILLGVRYAVLCYCGLRDADSDIADRVIYVFYIYRHIILNYDPVMKPRRGMYCSAAICLGAVVIICMSSFARYSVLRRHVLHTFW